MIQTKWAIYYELCWSCGVKVVTTYYQFTYRATRLIWSRARVFVQRIPEGASWQDLKDYFRFS
jgi:hypothetical protein